jgi:5-methylcytosine-specific restriction endonuclease McrA
VDYRPAVRVTTSAAITGCFVMSRARFSQEKIRKFYQWYTASPERSIPDAIERFGLDITNSGLAINFKRLGLEIKPRGGRVGKRRGERITLTCECCGCEFQILESQYRQRVSRPGVDRIRFCSQLCMGFNNRKSGTFTTVICDQCGKHFGKRTDKLTDKNYCCVQCLGKSKRVDGALWRDEKYIKKYMRQYNRENREQLRKRNRKYIKQNPHIKRKAQKKYRETHKASIAFWARGRRARVKQGEFSEQAWQDMKAGADYACLCCGEQEPEIKLEMDHVKPLALGGKHCISNIQPLCRSCNASKGATYADYR